MHFSLAPSPAAGYVPSMKVKQLAERFCEFHLNRYKPSEQHAKRLILKSYILPTFGEWELSEVDTAAVMDWTDMMLSKVSPKTASNRLAVLKRLLTYARDRKLIAEIPQIKMLKVRQQDARFLTEREVCDLIECMDPWFQNMAVIAVNTGLRAGELRALQWRDVDLKRRVLRVSRSAWSWTHEATAPKSGKPRTVSLNGNACAAFADILRLSDYVFGVPPKGLPVSYERIHVAMRRAVKEAGLKGDIGWHTLRHTFASHLARSGHVSLRTLQSLMGHANISTTMRYAHLFEDQGHDAVAVLDSALKAKKPVKAKV